jgi:hypothetical protein
MPRARPLLSHVGSLLLVFPIKSRERNL